MEIWWCFWGILDLDSKVVFKFVRKGRKVEEFSILVFKLWVVI